MTTRKRTGTDKEKARKSTRKKEIVRDLGAKGKDIKGGVDGGMTIKFPPEWTR